MSEISTAPVGVLGCGNYLPSRRVSNDEIAPAAGVDPAWVEERTGIRWRRRAQPDEAASDLAERAASDALKDAGIAAEDLSVIVVATSTPDYPQPPTACVVQQLLGVPRATAFDVNAVCSGFVYALETVRRLLSSGGYGLVVGVDVYSRILNPADRRTAVLFGDGAGAVVLGPVGSGRGVRAVQLTSFGQYHGLIRVPAGGSRTPASARTVAAGEHYFTMDGRGVREFVQREVPSAVHAFLREHDVAASLVQHLVPHQANGRMIEDLERRLELPNARTHSTVERYGNTGAAAVPITLADVRDELEPGDLVLLAAFGGGMTCGLALLSW